MKLTEDNILDEIDKVRRSIKRHYTKKTLVVNANTRKLIAAAMSKQSGDIITDVSTLWGMDITTDEVLADDVFYISEESYL